MSSNHPLSRRRFLKTALSLGAVGLCGPFATTARPDERGACELLATQLTRTLTQVESARAIGRHYLEVAPAEWDHRLLARLLWPADAAPLQELARMDVSALKQLLVTQQRRDFAAGRTVSLDGWVLSRTEARLCALLALR